MSFFREPNKTEKSIIKIILFSGLLFLLIRYFGNVLETFNHFIAVLMPIIIGAAMAYILNIPMTKIEEYYFPDRDDTWVKRTRRPVSIATSIIVILLFIFLVFYLVIPQLIGVISMIINTLPNFIMSIRNWGMSLEERFPQLQEVLGQINFNWNSITQNAISFLNSITSNVIDGTISTIGNTVGFIFNFFLSFVLSIFMLSNKEKLQYQLVLLSETYLPSRLHNQIMYVARILNESFKGFFVGTLTSATIEGVMVAVGLFLLRFPYPAMLGVLTGVTALIPYIGAFIATGIGFMLIFVQSPIQALGYVVFMIMVNQIEGNLLYPRVVGDSIGLPALWVIVAVTIGGGLFGIPGMILFVPLFSALSSIIHRDIAYRRDHGASISPEQELSEVMKNSSELYREKEAKNDEKN